MDQENLRHAFTVYKNILEFLLRNNYAISSAELSEQLFYSSAAEKKVVIEAVKKTEENQFAINTSAILLIGQDNAGKSSQDMEKLINSIPEKNNILIVSPEDISAGIQKRIDTLRIKKMENAEKPYINVFHYMKFSIVFPDRETASVHRVLSKAEATEVIKKDLITDRMSNGLILVTGPYADVQAVWIEARVGDVIHIRGKIETSGYADNYRIAVNGPAVRGK